MRHLAGPIFIRDGSWKVNWSRSLQVLVFFQVNVLKCLYLIITLTISEMAIFRAYFWIWKLQHEQYSRNTHPKPSVQQATFFTHQMLRNKLCKYTGRMYKFRIYDNICSSLSVWDSRKKLETKFTLLSFSDVVYHMSQSVRVGFSTIFVVGQKARATHFASIAL